MLPLRAASRAPVALALSLAALGCGARTTLDDGGGPSSGACTPPPPKVDVNGVWAIALGQATADDATFGVDVATDDGGDVVVAAALADVELGCPLTPRSGPGDLVIVKLDERDGSVAWTHAIGGPGFEADQVHVGLDARGRVYALATNHQGTPLTLEDGTVVAAPFVVALDQDGALRFAREVPEGPAITYVGGAPFVFSVAADGTFALAGGVVGDALVNGVSLPGGPGPESAAFVAVFGDDGAPVTAFEIEERDVPPLARIDALHFLPGGDLLVGGERFGVDGQPSSLYRTSAAGRLRWSTGVNASALAVRTDDVLLKENGPDPFARVDLGSGVPSVFAASIIHPEQPPSFRAAAAQGDGPAFFAGQWPPRDKPSEDVLAAVGAPTQLTDTFGCTAWNTFTGVAVAASGAPVVVGYLEGDAQLGVGVTLDPTCTGLRCATIFVSRIPF